MASLVFFLLGSAPAVGRRRIIRKARQVFLQLLVALGDSLLISVVHLDFLLQHKHQFRTPVALQTLGNLLPTGLNPRMT